MGKDLNMVVKMEILQLCKRRKGKVAIINKLIIILFNLIIKQMKKKKSPQLRPMSKCITLKIQTHLPNKSPPFQALMYPNKTNSHQQSTTILKPKNY